MERIDNLLLIYSPIRTNRLDYIVDLIFNRVLGLNFEVTNDKNVFEKFEYAKITYDFTNLFTCGSYISAHSLLFETDIHPVNIEIFNLEGHTAFFKTSGDSFFGFDIFAASFYLISRYEEYLPFKPDRFGRFSAEESLAFKEGFIGLPLVNIWIEMFCKKICQVFPNLKPVKPNFRYLSTIDVDNAWAHLNKGFVRTLFSSMKYILNGNIIGIIKKFKIICLRKNDPYDNYEFLNQLHSKYGIVPIYFFLFSRYSRYDKNPSQGNLNFRNLIKKTSRFYKIGLHPSFRSYHKFDIVTEEKEKLETIIEKPLELSRQHFLLIRMPDTFQNLIKLGIKKDFSMGYSTQIGFRASFCLPFQFFDLVSNHSTTLEIIPFAFMDTCFADYLKIKPEIALKEIKKIITSIQNVNGLLVSIWHNETFIIDKNQMSWREVYEQMLNEIQNGNQACKI